MEVEPTAAPDRSWTFYIVLFWVIAAVAIAVGMMYAAERHGTEQSSSPSADLMTGDFNARLALAGSRISSTPDAYARSAIGYYSLALPSPDAYRRIGILKQALLEEPGLNDLTRVDSPKAMRGLYREEKRKLTHEAAMWLRVYSGQPLSPSETARDVRFVGELSWGPLENAAVAEVYAHAGMLDRANSALAAARAGAYRVVVALFAIFATIALMGVVGIVVLAWFVFSRAPDAGPRGAISGPRVLFPAFVAYLLCGIVFSVLADSAALAVGADSSSVELILGLLANVAAFLVGMSVLRARAAEAGVDFREIGLRLNGILRTVKQGVLGYCAALPVMAVGLMGSLALQQTLLRRFPAQEHPIVPMMLGGRAALCLAYLLGVVAAPVIEETFFRGVLYTGLRSRMGMWGAAAFSGLLFASVHPTLPTGFLPIMALGMALAILRERTGSLFPGMICHALNNAIMLTLAVLLY